MPRDAVSPAPAASSSAWPGPEPSSSECSWCEVDSRQSTVHSWKIPVDSRLLLFLHFRQLGAEELHGAPDDGIDFGAVARALPGEGLAGDFAGRLAEIAVGRRAGLQHHAQGAAEGLPRDLRQDLSHGRLLEGFLGGRLV